MSYEFTDGFKIRNQEATHFLTFTVEGWIDIFSRQCYRDMIIESFNFCREKKGLQIGAYVIMTNHIHCIWTAKENNLSDIIRDFKTFTSKQIALAIQQGPESRKEWLMHMLAYFAKGTNGNKYTKLWKSGNHPEEISSKEFLLQKLNYIHENPVRASIVSNAADYIYSSASNYAGMKGILNIDFLF